MNTEWNASVSALLKKSRQLRKDMMKILTDDSGRHLGSEESTPFGIGIATDSLSSFLELKSSQNVFTTELETTNFILEDKLGLSSSEVQTLRMLHPSSTLISSDDEEDLSESGDPLHDASIVGNLFYKCEILDTSGNCQETQISDAYPVKMKQPIRKDVKFGSVPKTKNSTNRPRQILKRSISSAVQKDNLLNSSLQKSSVATKKLNFSSEKGIAMSSHIIDKNLQHIIVHCLLMVPSGVGFASSCQSRYFHSGCKEKNLYLVCRMFWTSNIVRSDLCWNASNPKFQFRQVAPVQITSTLLERLRSNFLVIEVWSKSIAPKSDEIIGICKVPLHLFYLTFHDENIADSFFKSKQPVIAVNDNLPVVDLLSGVKVGQLKVLLAMGKLEQIAHLQENPPIVIDDDKSKMPTRNKKLIEHTFVVSINTLKLFLPPGSNIWGESDCHVQYFFPAQDLKIDSKFSDLHLSKCKTSAHLCETDIVFQSVTKHTIVLSHDVSVQKCVLQVLPRQGIPIQVWCKYYHPVECEELVGEAYLPLSKVCALTLLQEDINSSSETFSLGLEPCSIANNSNSDIEITEQFGRIDMKIVYQRQALVNHKNKCKNGDEVAEELIWDSEESDSNISMIVPALFNEVVKVHEKQSLNNKSVSEQNSVEVYSNTALLLHITIERGSHLANVKPKISGESVPPNSCVSLPLTSTSNCPSIVTKVVISSNDPMWNSHGEVSLLFEDLFQLQKHLVFHIWHVYEEYIPLEANCITPIEKGVIIGFASVDLSPLLVGMQILSGWYNVIDFEGLCKGQIQIAIKPKHRIQSLPTLIFDSSVLTKNSSKGCLTTSHSDFLSHCACDAEGSMNYENHSKATDYDEEGDKLAKGVAISDDFPEDSISFLMELLTEKLSNLDTLQESMEHWLGHISKSNSFVEHNKNAEQEQLSPSGSIALQVDTNVMDKLTEENLNNYTEVYFLPHQINNVEMLSKSDIIVNKDNNSELSSQHSKEITRNAEMHSKNHSRLAAAIFKSAQVISK